MEETRIQTPTIGAADTLTSNPPLDALGPDIAAEGTYPPNDASCESLGVVMPSNTDFCCLPTTMMLHMKVWASRCSLNR